MDKTPEPVSHLTPEGYTMRRRSCDFVAQGLEFVLRHVRLRVKQGGHMEGVSEGDIFLFNHFTRFETVITSYLLYRQTGQFVRSIADKSLFRFSTRFGRLLREVGAVPNDMDGVLTFLAAEILRGHKVLIFPEGGMVKDRRVRDEDGKYGAYSSLSGVRRKHHRGAAVLTLVLDVFKHHIRTLEAAGDTAKLEEWRKALGIESVDHLLERAGKPTVLVPGNITYFPIRATRNTFSWLLEKLLGEAPQQLLEEVIIEGNILFKDTDMDVRYGRPLHSSFALNKREQAALDRQLADFTSFGDFFAQRDKGLSANPLNRLVEKHGSLLRESYMQGIYSNTTLNMNHLVATAIHLLHQQKKYEVRQETFHKALYLALKSLHADPAIRLHRSLYWPWRYKGLVDGSCLSFKSFMKTCERARLVKKTGDVYRLSHRLEDEFDMVDIRLENPVAMHANEAETVPALRPILEKALAHADDARPQEIAARLFDDLKQDFHLKWEYFSARHPALCPTIKKPEEGEPFLLLPKGAEKKRANVGVVLVHGFNAGPKALRAYGEQLVQKGYVVMGVRLPGHSTTPYDAEKRTRHDWLEAVASGYRIAASYAEKVVIVGSSTGGTLALKLAAEKEMPRLVGIAAAAAPVVVRDKNIHLLPVIMLLTKLLGWIPTVHNLLRFYTSPTPEAGIHYPVKSVASLNQLRLLLREVRKALPKVKQPVLILQGDADETVNPISADIIFNGLARAEREIHPIPGGTHALIYKDIGETRAFINAFIKRVTK